MECLLLSFSVFILGAFVILLAKPEYKAKLFSIFLITGIGTAAVPAVVSIMNGSSLDIEVPYTLCFQTLTFNMDPFSAFMTILMTIAGILYGLNILFQKQAKYQGNMLFITILGVLLSLFAVNIQNGVYFYLAISLLSLLLLFFINIVSENRQQIVFKSLPIYLSVMCVTLIIMTLGIFVNSMEYSDMVKGLISSNNCSYFIFTLGAIGFALPALLSEKIINSYQSEKFKYSEPLFLWVLFYTLNFYCFLRFIGMGAVPSPACQWICIILIFAYAGFYIYKYIKAKDIQKTTSYTKIIQISLSILALLIGVSGYISQNINIFILGCMTSLLFFVNTILCSYSLQMKFKCNLSNDTEIASEKDSVWKNNRISNLAALISVGSFAGLPTTFGFWAWLSLFSLLFIGCFSQELYIKQLSVFLILFSVIVFSAQVYKFYSIFKNYDKWELSECSFPMFNIILSGMVILLGVCFSKVFKLFVVPVSLFSGGTKFYDLFQSVGKSVNVLNNYILGLLILVVFVVIALKISVLTKKR